MKKTLDFILQLWAIVLLLGQGIGTLQAQITSNIETIEMRQFTSNDVMVGRELPPPDTEGDFYYYSDWRQARVVFDSNKVIEQYPIKLDLENSLLEIKTEKMVKIMKSSRVEYFTWKGEKGKELFVNSQKFDLGGTELVGFFRVEQEGEPYSLLSRRETKIKKATYIEGLDVGSRSNKVLKEDAFYLAKGDKLFLLSGSKRKRIGIIEEAIGQPFRPILKKNDFGVSNREELMELVFWLNQKIVKE